MGNNSVRDGQIKIPKPNAHFPIIGRKSTKFQINPIKDVRGVAETRSRTDGRMDGRNNAHMVKGHFYSPPPLRRVTIRIL